MRKRGDIMRNYFAYGSCVNLESFTETMRKAGCEDRFEVLGVGILKDHRLAFTRYSSKWGGGVLDVIPSQGDVVKGVVYSVPEEGTRSIDAREGHPSCYVRQDSVRVMLGWEEVEVFTYTVKDREPEEVEPAQAYVQTVLEGMKTRLPAEYVNRFLLEPLRERFGMKVADLPVTMPYHFSPREEETAFQRENRHFYDLILQITTYLGDDNMKAEAVRPTPQMFRNLAKLTEIAARDRLDYGHLIPREIHNRLAEEFTRISGVETFRLPC
jgi:gamma-glutamylcyclotransferase (GGCT)/AIG2-like uncharacterized protein YtfP